jgi:hypothetical protein
VKTAGALSAAKVDANRRNAARSTGPRTLAGKRICAANATQHAILAVAPVVRGVESAADWEAHRGATISSLSPVGYVETLLADRVAAHFWRLGRVARYETENTAESAATAAGVYGGHMAPIFAEEEAHRSETVGAFRTLEEADDDAAIAPSVAEVVLTTVASRAGVEADEGWRHSLPVDVKLWTKRLVVEAVGALLAATKDDGLKRLGPGPAILAVAAREDAERRDASKARADIEAKLRRSASASLLLRGNDLDKVARYEAHLERGLYKALHELQRMQATRAGADVVPRALDLAVSVDDDENEPRRVAPFRRATEDSAQ